MPDLHDEQISEFCKITNQAEDEVMKITPLSEASVSDILDNGGLSTSKSIGLTAIELYCGVSSIKTDRKLLIFQLTDDDGYFGFASDSQPFEIFKRQIVTIAAGENTHVWAKAKSSSKNIAIGEF